LPVVNNAERERHNRKAIRMRTGVPILQEEDCPEVNQND